MINAINLLNQPLDVLEIELQKLKNSETTRFLCDYLPASLPVVRPGCLWCMAPEYLHNKGNYIGLVKLFF